MNATVKRWLPHGLILGGALAAAVVFGTARPSGALGAAPAAGRDNAAVVYLRDCAVCHGADATGTSRGPSLIGVGRAAVDYWVSSGRMPLYGDAGRPARTPVQRPKPGEQLGDTFAPSSRRPAAYPPDTIRALTDYVAGLGAGSGPGIPQVDLSRADVAVGGTLFRQQCAACHAWDGDGGALLHREAPSVHPATSQQVAEAIRTGPGNMPAFGTASISERDLASVVAYVRYVDHPKDRGGQALWHLGPVAEGGVVWIVGIGLVFLILRWIGERS